MQPGGPPDGAMGLNSRTHLYASLAGTALLAAGAGLLAGFWLSNPPPHGPGKEEPAAAAEREPRNEAAETPAPPADEPETAVVDTAALEEIVDRLEIPAGGRFSIAIHDITGRQRLLARDSGRLHRAASLYKLYLAYVAYEDVDAGRLALEQPLINHPAYRYEINLGACLHLMIAVSDSPCGETLLAHYDYPALQTRLKRLGLPHANAGAFQVSAEDMVRLLGLIHGDNLSADSRNKLLAAMGNQAYDVILQPAFRGYGRVYNKTGAWRDEAGGGYFWVDAGIVELSGSGRVLAVSILHDNVPTENLLALAEDLAAVIAAAENP